MQTVRTLVFSTLFMTDVVRHYIRLPPSPSTMDVVLKAAAAPASESSIERNSTIFSLSVLVLLAVLANQECVHVDRSRFRRDIPIPPWT